MQTNFNVVADQAVQHFADFVHHVIHVQQFRLQHLLAAESEQLASQSSGARSGFLDFLGVATAEVVRGGALKDALGAALDDH